MKSSLEECEIEILPFECQNLHSKYLKIMIQVPKDCRDNA